MPNSKSTFELYVIDKVKEKRIQSGVSQLALATQMEIAPSFIGRIEDPKSPAKYNLNHINKLAKIFNCSPQDFLPDNPL